MQALYSLVEEGFSAVADGERLLISPADRLTDELRAFIRQHKSEILEALTASWGELEAAINACCDKRCDSDENRRALIDDCRNEPADQWPWYRWYFEQEAAKWSQ